MVKIVILRFRGKNKIAIFIMKEALEKKVYLDFFAQRPISNKSSFLKVEKSKKIIFREMAWICQTLWEITAVTPVKTVFKNWQNCRFLA